MGGAESNHRAIVRRPTHSTSHRTTHSSAHRRARGTQWKGLRAPATHSNTHSNTHRTTHSNTHRSWSQPCEWRGSIESSRLMIGLSGRPGLRKPRRISPPVSVAVSVAVRSAVSPWAQHHRRPARKERRKCATRNQPAADPPPGFTGDLAADLGTSLGGEGPPRAAARGPLRGTARAGACRGDRGESRLRSGASARRPRPRRAPSPLRPAVLSAHKLGPKGVEYYVSYAGRGAEGYWLGKAAASLGLVGAVDPAAFRALAKGEHPDGGRLLERVATDHTPGWDFTLSAPKSVSLAWALADEPLRAALAEAHRGAVKAAFSFLEDEGGRARRGFGGRDGHVPAGLAVACFVHPASRELDPQLHTHGIVCNVVEGSDGRWTALDSRMIYLHRRAAASIYRAELRERVAELGGQWLMPDRRGLSELEGFDREVLRSFSQRRNAIEAELERTGRSGPRASEAACLKTRRDKLDVELVELRDTWAQRARALGVTRDSVTALLDGTDRRVAPTAAEVAAARSELVGSAGLTRAQAAFTRDDVIVAWAERCTQGARRSRARRTRRRHPRRSRRGPPRRRG